MRRGSNASHSQRDRSFGFSEDNDDGPSRVVDLRRWGTGSISRLVFSPRRRASSISCCTIQAPQKTLRALADLG